MKHGRTGNERALREAPQIRTLISDLDRIVQILNCDIATEEERVRLFDRSDVTYPLLASTLAARRDNLRDAIAVFEQRLATIKAELSLKVGDGGNREGGISWGCLTPPLLHQRSDMPCPKITSSS